MHSLYFYLVLTTVVSEPQGGYPYLLVQNHVQQRRSKRTTHHKLKPQYQNCQGKDIYQLDSKLRNQTSLSETEAKGPCIDCVLEGQENQILEDISHTISKDGKKQQNQARPKDQKQPRQVFKQKLQKRVIGLIQSKIAETERLKACMKGDRDWFAKKAPKVDWPLMQEVCQKDKKALSQSIKAGWKEMRINMALTFVNPDQIVTGNPNLSFPLEHEVSSFGSIKKLSRKEKEQVKKTWARYLNPKAHKPVGYEQGADFEDSSPSKQALKHEEHSKTLLYRSHLKIPDVELNGPRYFDVQATEKSYPLGIKTLSPSQFETAFLKGDGRVLGKNLSTDDIETLRRNTRKMQKESRDRYRKILEEMPLLAYLKTGDPDNQKDMDQAFSKINQKLQDSLEKIKDKDVDMGVLLSFKPLVEGLLQESEGGYCLIAEREREKAEKEESLEKAGLLALGVLSAVPCFMAGPVGAVACLGVGLGAGSAGYAVAKVNLKDSLGRALMGKEYEQMAELAKRDKEKFWELILLPTAGFGTTWGAIKGAKALTRKALAKKTPTADTKALWSVKPHIDPQDIRIKKIAGNTKGPTETFHIQWTSSNKKEMEFQLEIPKETLEKNKSDIEEHIKDVVEDDAMTAKEAEEFAIQHRREGDLLFHIQKYISQMSEESFEGIEKLSLKDLESMLISQYKNGVFEHFVQSYKKAGPVKLSHIGTENVHIQKTREDRDWTEYNVQFKTQKGKQMSLKLEIAKEDEAKIPDRYVLDTIRDLGDMDQRVLSIRQKMQLAIGQMPAEIFKGLKSITFKSSVAVETGVRGSVKAIWPGMRIGGKKGKYILHSLPKSLKYRLPISESLVHAFMKATKSTKSEMYLAQAHLSDIPLGYKGELTSVLAHELGHVVQLTEHSFPPMPQYTDTTVRNPKAWSSAIQKDGSSVSKYGDTKETEDFAEAMRVYIQTDGGVKSPEALEKYANRFEILDTLMKSSRADRQTAFSKFKKAMEKRGVVFVIGSKALTHVVVSNHAYILPPTTDKTQETKSL